MAAGQGADLLRAGEQTARHLIAYSVGVYLGVNAIRDAYLVVDGPDCAFMRTQFIQGNHDYLSTLTSVSGHHRVINTALDPARVMHDREDELCELLIEVARAPEVGGVLLTSLPLASVLAADYQRICRRAAREAGKDIVHVPGKSLQTDWLGGYGETLKALARGIALGPAEPDPRRVAVVGALHDRNEADCEGDLRELERLLAGLGLELVSAWPAGGDWAELDAIRRAGLIIGLPYARQAARILAERLDARLIECALPFGLEATGRWLQRVAEAAGVAGRAEALIEAELARLVPRLEWVLPSQIEGRRFGFIGDPHLLEGFAEILATGGAELAFAVVTNCRHHLQADPGRLAGQVLVEPRVAPLLEFLRQQLAPGRIDCLVTNDSCLDVADPNHYAVVEFGFPANAAHALYDRPRLGYAGLLAFIDTLANSCRLQRALADRIPLHGDGG
jgi:nitrogenase molybdenum-iron protein alpha/beta subunit